MKVCVLGGGISGLTSGLLLSRASKHVNVHLFEASDSFGGWVRSMPSPSKSGAIFDLGPHSARLNTPSSFASLALARYLNLQDRVLWLKTNSAAAKRYIYADSRLVPVKFLSFKRTPPMTKSSMSILLRAALKKSPSEQMEDMSVDEFFRTRFHPEFADYLASALIRGIFAGDSRKISLNAALPFLGELNAQPGGNIIWKSLKASLFNKNDQEEKQLRPFIQDVLGSDSYLRTPRRSFAWSLLGGMGQLPIALEQTLSECPNVTLVKNAPVKSVDFDAKTRQYTLNGDQQHRYDAVISCIPMHGYQSCLPKSLLDQFVQDDKVRALLEMPWADVAVCVLELDNRAKIELPRPAFGHLVPRCEDDHVLGVIYDSVAFPQMDGHSQDRPTMRFTVMMNPSKNRTLVREAACQALNLQLGIDCYERNPPVAHHAEILRKCIPHYPVGHRQNVQRFRELLQRSGLADSLLFAGSSLDGVSLNDSILSAFKSVQVLLCK